MSQDFNTVTDADVYKWPAVTWRPHEPSREATIESQRASIVDRAVAIVRRPVRFQGRTVEIFDADAKEQLPILTKLRDLLVEIQKISGDSVTTIFHTRAETHRLYANFVDHFPHACHYVVEVNFDGKRKFFCDLCGGAF